MKYSIQSSIAWQICERPRLGVAKNVQQFVPRNTRGCPAVTQIAGNKYVSGARPSVSPHGCCLCARICQEWCTCACEGGQYVSADLGNFGVGSYRGVVLSKGIGESTNLSLWSPDKRSLFCVWINHRDLVPKVWLWIKINLSYWKQLLYEIDKIIQCWVLHYFKFKVP